MNICIINTNHRKPKYFSLNNITFLLKNTLSKIYNVKKIYISGNFSPKIIYLKNKEISFVKKIKLKKILSSEKKIQNLIFINIYYIMDIKNLFKKFFHVLKKKNILEVNLFKNLETQLNPYKQLKIKNPYIFDQRKKNKNYVTRQELPKYIYKIPAFKIRTKLFYDNTKKKIFKKVTRLIMENNDISFEIKDSADYEFYKYLVKNKKL